MRAGHISPEKIVVIDGLHTAKRGSKFPACLRRRTIVERLKAPLTVQPPGPIRPKLIECQKEQCNVKWICAVAIGSLATTGCSSLVADAPSPGYASLEFADARTGKDSIPGTFHSVGGLDIPTTSSAIYVKAGWRRIGYTCPDHLTLDGPPTTTAVFEAGASYRLKCVASEAVIERIDGE